VIFLTTNGRNEKDEREKRRERRRWARGGDVVDFEFECVGAGQSERLDHVFISTYREQTHRIDKAGYGSEIWLHGVVSLVSEPSARTGLTSRKRKRYHPHFSAHFGSRSSD